MYSDLERNKIFLKAKESAPIYNNDDLMFYYALNKDLFTLYGTGIKEKNTYYRFSNEDINNIAKVSADVSFLATHSAGIKLRFKTNSRIIRIRVLENGIHDMRNMNFMAQCGFDLYSKEDGDKEFIYQNTSFPNYIDNKKYIADIGLYNDKKERDILIHFPLYCGVIYLEIGLEKDAIVKPSFYENEGKIVCYGTSILQGGCVSRPGLNITNVLSRTFSKDVINYGFSGAGLMEKEVAEIINKIDDIDLLIIDAEANAGCDKWMYENFDNFLNVFYKKYPNLPIIIMNKTQMAIDYQFEKNKLLKEFYDDFLINKVKEYQDKGKNIIFINNYNLFDIYKNNFAECTVDGVHPNDLGMYLLTNNYIKAIKQITNKNY